MTTAVEFQAKVTKAVINMERFDEFVNGGVTDDVVTDGGTVPSMAKFQDELAEEITLAVGTTPGLKAEAAALGVSTSALDMGTFAGGLIPDNSSAKQALQILETELGTMYRVRGDGSTDCTSLIQAAMAIGYATVELTGDILVSGSGVLFDIKIGQRITGNATITHNTTTGITFRAANVNDWRIDGGVTVIGAGKASGTAAALLIQGCNRYSVSNFWAKQVSGWGRKIDPGTVEGYRGDTGSFVGCGAIECWYGLEGTPGTGAEYIDFVNDKAVGCRYGTTVASGNWSFLGGCDEGNDDGFTMFGGSNNAHGNIVGRKMNHNTGWNFKADGVTNGQRLSACSIYGDSATAGKIIITASKGISISHSLIDAKIEASSNTGLNTINDNSFPGSITAVTCDDWSKLELSGNRTLTGFSPLNRPTRGAWWVKFHWSGSTLVIDGGTPGITVTRDALGEYSVNLPFALPSDDYGLNVTVKAPGGHPVSYGIGQVLDSALKLYTYDLYPTTAAIDPEMVWVTVNL